MGVFARLMGGGRFYIVSNLFFKIKVFFDASNKIAQAKLRFFRFLKELV